MIYPNNFHVYAKAVHTPLFGSAVPQVRRGSESEIHWAVAPFVRNISSKKLRSAIRTLGKLPTMARPRGSFEPSRLSCTTRNSMMHVLRVSLATSKMSASLNTGHTLHRCTPVFRFFSFLPECQRLTLTYGSAKPTNTNAIITHLYDTKHKTEYR